MALSNTRTTPGTRITIPKTLRPAHDPPLSHLVPLCGSHYAIHPGLRSREVEDLSTVMDMSHEFRLSDISEGLVDAEIVEWFVTVGITIEAGQPVAEIETATTTVEITATHPGTVLHLGGAPGDTIDVGEVLFVVGEQGEDYRVGSTSKPRDHTPPDVEHASHDDISEELTPLSRVRKRIARHMMESWTTIPHVTVQADIRAEGLLEARKSRAFKVLPIESLVAVAALPVLERYPEFNASMHGDAVAYWNRYDLGFAVDTDAGLLVVVVRDANQLTLEELAAEFERLAAGATVGTLTPDDLIGQTFTISNIGSLGGGHGTPIIPMGTTAILSIGRAKESPVVEDGRLGVGVVAPIDLSYDHRLIDGALGQRFLSDLVDNLERIESFTSGFRR